MVTEQIGKFLIGTAASAAAVFTALKLFAFIHWSWWWVFSPVWILLCIIVISAFLEVLVTRRSKH